MTEDRKVQGQCPMGCGDTLFLGSGGYVTCSWVMCPDPVAVSDLLLDHATPNHIVRLGPTSFSIQHPLRERLRGEMFDCPLHEHLNTLSGPPRQQGRYRVVEQGEHPSSWLWVRTEPYPTVPSTSEAESSLG